jgi:NAD kinase
MMVLVLKQNLHSKELSRHKEFKKRPVWAGEADQLVRELDLVVCLGGDGSLLRVSHMF